MIPLRLYMRNFMCYREQSLDFRGIHLACLTGNNGNGKSAILDALTWALWGRSRLGARRDDELIHLGQSDMAVEFEFVLVGSAAEGEHEPHGGTRYRVLRQRARDSDRRRGQSSLELQGWDPAQSRFRSLSEPSISATQSQIDQLLRMDYDTFINSAFLLQGRADEFTIKRPADRKRVLGDILGLQIYDRYEEMAKEQAQAQREQADQLLAAIEQIDRELAREPEYRAAVGAAEADLARLQTERAGVERAYNEARQALQEAEAAQQRLAEVQRRLAVAQTEGERLAEEMTRHLLRLQELEGALQQAGEIEQAFQAYQQAAADNDAWNYKLSELVSLNERRSQLDKEIDAARHELDKARVAAQERVQQLERTAQALDQTPEWEQTQAELARLDARAAEREALVAGQQALAAQTATLTADNKRAEQDAQQLKDKIQLLSAHRHGAHGAEAVDLAHCPLCGQPLDETDCERLAGDFQRELESEREAYRQRVTQIKDSQQRAVDVQAEIAGIDRELRDRGGLQRKEVALAMAIDEARQAQEALPDARAAQQTLQDRLQAGDYALATRDALRQVMSELDELGYDTAVHQAIQRQLEVTRGAQDRIQLLREARSSVETVRLAIAQLEHSQNEVHKRLEADRSLADELDLVAGALVERRQQAASARQALDAAHDMEQNANLRLGAARNKLDYCADLRKQREKRQQEERQLREEQGIYEELRRALGKNGVQAMIIESAIPEIEHEANQLLARMTRGSMHVILDTQRGTKTGGTIETLDIHITDPLGTRRYETYSGGERYRIDFTIRIALSKLLARRAGAQLQMLVIDEGFGTQDSEGRDGLVEAINAIQDDFACILAITHIEELKDAFNVRIDVEKTPEGSQISIR